MDLTYKLDMDDIYFSSIVLSSTGNVILVKIMNSSGNMMGSHRIEVVDMTNPPVVISDPSILSSLIDLSIIRDSSVVAIVMNGAILSVNSIGTITTERIWNLPDRFAKLTTIDICHGVPCATVYTKGSSLPEAIALSELF